MKKKIKGERRKTKMGKRFQKNEEKRACWCHRVFGLNLHCSFGRGLEMHSKVIRIVLCVASVKNAHRIRTNIDDRKQWIRVLWMRPEISFTHSADLLSCIRWNLRWKMSIFSLVDVWKKTNDNLKARENENRKVFNTIVITIEPKMAVKLWMCHRWKETILKSNNFIVISSH